jgi:ABC-type glycerol-3-phosphate transport system substrate-binding protein
MEKIIFFGLSIPILGFVLYLGATAIMSGFSAKNANKENKNIDDENNEENFNDEDKLSDELNKLNKLLKEGVLTQEEFEKAKKKILEN